MSVSVLCVINTCTSMREDVYIDVYIYRLTHTNVYVYLFYIIKHKYNPVYTHVYNQVLAVSLSMMFLVYI